MLVASLRLTVTRTRKLWSSACRAPSVNLLDGGAHDLPSALDFSRAQRCASPDVRNLMAAVTSRLAQSTFAVSSCATSWGDRRFSGRGCTSLSRFCWVKWRLRLGVTAPTVTGVRTGWRTAPPLSIYRHAASLLRQGCSCSGCSAVESPWRARYDCKKASLQKPLPTV
jgi:hypothetical protein